MLTLSLFSLYGALCNPLVLTFLAAALDTAITFPGVSPLTLLYRSAQAWQNGVMFSIVDSYIYGNMLYTILTVWILPIWLLFYLNITTNPTDAAEPINFTNIQLKKKQ